MTQRSEIRFVLLLAGLCGVLMMILGVAALMLVLMGGALVASQASLIPACATPSIPSSLVGWCGLGAAALGATVGLASFGALIYG